MVFTWRITVFSNGLFGFQKFPRSDIMRSFRPASSNEQTNN